MKLPKTLTDRVTRTLILSMAFFFSGLAFFAFRMSDSGQQANAPREFSFDEDPVIEERARLLPSLAKYPDPSVFHQFTYARGAELTVKGECADAYHVVMIFNEGVDYRAAPMDARFNTAYPCASESFAERIPIDALFLEDGARYYVIKAHQGAKGTWYDPY